MEKLLFYGRLKSVYILAFALKHYHKSIILKINLG